MVSKGLVSLTLAVKQPPLLLTHPSCCLEVHGSAFKSLNMKINKIAFEWDSNKAEINLRKHGVSFETASEVFEDPFLQVIDEQIIDNELREVVIGITSTWRLL